MSKFNEIFNYTTSTIISVLSGVLWIPIITRFLTTSDFAYFSFLNQIFLFFSTIFLIGTYYIQTSNKFNTEVRRNIRVINISVVILIIPIILFFIKLSIINTLVILILLFLYATFQNNMVYFNAYSKSDKYSISQNIYSFLKVSIVLLLLLLSPNYIMVFIGMIISLLVANSYSKKHIIEKKSEVLFLNPKTSIKEILNIGFPFAVFSVVLNLFVFLDFHFFYKAIDVNSLALFSSYSSLINSIYSIPISISILYILPKYRSPNKQKEKNLNLSLLTNVIVLIVMILVFSFIGKFIFSVLLPESYYLGIDIILLFILVSFLMNIVKQIALHFQFTLFNRYYYFVLLFLILIVIKYIYFTFIEISIYKSIFLNMSLLSVLIISCLIYTKEWIKIRKDTY